MRIYEILFWDKNPTGENSSGSQLDFPPGPFNDDLTNLANAFTRRRGLVKHLWNLPDPKRSHPDQRRLTKPS
jgi:hypothetical protein